jgi:hypothetical protein
MTTTNCANTGREAHDTANAAFGEAASQLEELGYLHEMTSDGVVFSRAVTAVEDYDPEARITAAAFLGLSGTVELGSLDQVIDAAAYKGFNRCPVLVCSKSKEKGAKNICYRLCANPSKFHANGRHFCGVHKYTLKNHPSALEEGRVFDCKTNVVVCSRVYGVALAYSLNEAHVGGHCERVGATAGMKMRLPFNLMPTSKDVDLLSIVPRAIPD